MDVILPQNDELLHYGKFYKFLSVKSALKTLQSCKLRYSNPTLFNDPLDCSKFLFDLKIPETQLTVKALTHSEKEMINRLINERFGQSLTDLMNSVNFVYDLNKLKAGLNDEMKINFLELIKQEFLSKEEIEKYRITCFSKSYYSQKSFLMWSHYANSHQGICLEFNNKLNPNSFNINGFTPLKVKYQSKYPKIRTKSYFDSNIWLWTKLKRFSYEKEVRVIKKSNKSKDCSYIKFPKKCLTKIIFGINTPKRVIQRVKEIVTCNFEIDKIKFEKMYTDKESLRLTKANYDINNLFPFI